MAWTRGLLDPTRAWPQQSGLLALDPSEGATMFSPWPGFAPPVAPGVPGGYPSSLNPPSDPWLYPSFYPPEFPGASRVPIPWLGSDVDGAGPWPADLPPWAFWPGPAPGAWPRREPDLDAGFLEPAPLAWPRPEPYPRRRPLGDDVKLFRPLPYYPERDRFVPTPLTYYFDQDDGAVILEAQESGAEAPEGTRGLLDPRHWGAAEADDESNAGSNAANRDEARTVEDLARRLGLDPVDVAQIDSAPTLGLADVLANRQLDEDTRQNVQDRLNAIIEQNRGPSGDPHEFGAALDLRARLDSAAADLSPSSSEKVILPFDQPGALPQPGEALLAQALSSDTDPADEAYPWYRPPADPASPQPADPFAVLDKFRGDAYRGRLIGLETAPRYLDHYIDATGSPMELTREMVRAEPRFRAGERTLEGFYEKSLVDPPMRAGTVKESSNFADRLRALKDGEATTFSDRWDVRLPGLYDPRHGGLDLNFALGWGDSSLSSSGFVTATRQGNTIHVEGTVTHMLNDPYDFHKGKSFAEDAHLLERHGLAKPYERQGTWDRRLTGTIELRNGRLENQKFSWKDLD